MADDLKKRFEARAAALRRFAAWEREHPERHDPAQALHLVGGLWELLPPEARERPIDVSGIAEMRRCLAVLGSSR